MIHLLLGDLIELKYGKSLRKNMRSKGDVPVFGSNGQVDVHSESLVNQPTIIVGRKGSIGEVHLVKTPCWPIDTTYFVNLISEHKVHLDWLYLLLRTLRLQGLNRSAAIPGLNRDDVYRIPIALPPFEDQIRIAHVLGKVEVLTVNRKQQLQQLDDVLMSLFLKMFGDPVRNEMSWNIQPCNRVVLDISSGTSYSGEERAFDNENEIGVLKISAVTKGTFDPAEFKVVSSSQITKTLRFVKRGDFLFSRANTHELVAACCVVPIDYNRLFLPDKLWVLTFNNELVNHQYFNYLLKNSHFRNIVRRLASGGHDSMLNISMKKFMTLNIPCPSIDLQEEFSQFVENVENLKIQLQQSITHLGELYGALSEQAFKGELNLSRVHIPDKIIQEGKAIEKVHLQTNGDLNNAINRTDTHNSLETIENTESIEARGTRDTLITQWLEAFISEQKNTPLSVEKIIAAAHTFSLERNTDINFVFEANDYEYVKTWLFEALGTNRLKQVYDDTGNKIQIVAV